MPGQRTLTATPILFSLNTIGLVPTETSRVIPMKRIIISTSMLVLMACAAPAASIAIKFATEASAGAGNYTRVTSTAGAVPQGNWNNIDLPRGNGLAPGSASSIIDDSGVTIAGLSMSYDADAAYVNGAAGSGGDVTLGYGGMESQTGSYGTGNQVSLTGVPYAQYDLYLYVNGWTSGRTGKALLNGGGEKTFQTLQDFPGTHVESTSDAVAGSYIVWGGVTGDPTIQFANGNNNIMVGGLQIVQVPEPVAASLVGLAGLALMARRRQ